MFDQLTGNLISGAIGVVLFIVVSLIVSTKFMTHIPKDPEEDPHEVQ